MIDGGCFIGQPMDAGEQFTASKLLKSMDRFGVERAVVGSFRCLFQDLRRGNEEVAKLATANPDRIIPLGILHQARYEDSPKDLLRWMKFSLGFKAAGIFSTPPYYPVEWTSPWMEELGDALEDLEMVVQTGIQTEAELAGIVKAWGGRKFPVMIRWIGSHRYRMFSHELAAVKRHANIFLDVGNACSIGAIERLAEAAGANRLFFASNEPVTMRAPAHAILQEARLTNDSRRCIESDTIAKVMDLPIRSEQGTRSAQPWLSEWKSLLEEPKFDTHWHPDAWNLGEPRMSAAEQSSVFETFRYVRVLGFSVTAINYDIEEGNCRTADWLALNPSHRALIVVNPLRLEASLAEIGKWGSHPGFVGIKTIQDNYGIGLDHELYSPLLEEADRRNMPVLAHLTGMQGAAKRFPSVRFIAAHANWGRLRGLGQMHNVSFDFSTSHAFTAETQLARFIREVGSHRVLFGSDGQLVSPAWSLAKLLDCGLSPAELKRILQDNARSLFPDPEGSR